MTKLAILWISFGFYTAMTVCAWTLGNEQFNQAFPLPYRLLICIPALVCAVYAIHDIWRILREQCNS